MHRCGCKAAACTTYIDNSYIVQMYSSKGTTDNGKVASYPGHAKKKRLFFSAWPGYEANGKAKIAGCLSLRAL